MSAEDISHEARIVALEYFATRTYNKLLALAGISEDQVRALEDSDVHNMGLRAIGIHDPAMSDHVSGELQDALIRLQNAAREMRGAEKS